jgi:hypothetical protein
MQRFDHRFVCVIYFARCRLIFHKMLCLRLKKSSFFYILRLNNRTKRLLMLIIFHFLILFLLYFLNHSQVNIDVEDINDNSPTFESSAVRISVPENVELETALYVVSATDRDSGKSGTITYRLSNNNNNNSNSSISGNLFSIDSTTGYLTLSQHLDYETSQRHTLVVTATDSGEPPLSSNLTIFVEVQDVNDNLPIFERNEYTIKVLESTPINSQVSAQIIYVN